MKPGARPRSFSVERLLGLFLPSDKFGAVLADFEDFRADEPGRPQHFLYACDLLAYAIGFALRRRLFWLTLRGRGEIRRDPYLYLSWLLLGPYLYVYFGLGAYFLDGGGNYLWLSGQYPLVLNFPAAVTLALLLPPAALALVLSVFMRGALRHRLPQLVLSCCGFLFAVLLHYASFY